MAWHSFNPRYGNWIPLALAVAGLSVASVVAQNAKAADLNAVGLADACSSCHGVDGHSQGFIPSLAGVDKNTLVSMLKAFKAQSGNPTIMGRIARGYTDAEFEALADYFSAVKSK